MPIVANHPELNDKEQRVLGKLQNTPGLVLAHGVGTGKALAEDEPVMTPRGPVKIKDIRVGDSVLNEQGTVSVVTGVYPQGELEVFKVTFQDGSTVECCDEHLWEVMSYRGRKNKKRSKAASKYEQVLPLSEIKQALNTPRGEANFSIKVTKPVAFKYQSVIIDPYLMGALLGDGHFHAKYVSLSTCDAEMVEAFARLLPDTIKLKKKSGSYDFSLTSGFGSRFNTVNREISRLGLKTKRSWEKFIPNEYKINTTDVRTAVLQGLLDTDGTVDRRNGTISFCSTSKQLIEDVTFLVQSLGGVATVSSRVPTYTYRGERKKGREAFNLWICLPNEISPFRLTRKAELVKAKSKYLPIRYFKKVESAGIKPAVCISVDNPSRLFLTKSFIVTHNTRSSIQVANQLGQNTDVIVPAALKDNYKKELNKWLGGVPDQFNIESQQTVGRSGLPGGGTNGTLIVDEAHRARDPQSQLLGELKKSPAMKKLLLTATPIYNSPHDAAALINLAANRKVLPEDKGEFYKKYVGIKKIQPSLVQRLMGVAPGEVEVLRNTNELGKIFGKYIDYEPGGDREGFPSSQEETVKVPVTKNQQEIYNTIMDKAPLWVKRKIKSGLPPNKQELTTLQAFLTGARQVSNSNYDFIQNKQNFEAPKAQTAAKYLIDQIRQNPSYKGVVYSNYLNSGLAPYKQYLDKASIPYGEFSGDINPAIRDQMVRDYNANKLKALLISSAGAEGLDLKGTRLLQILEPHFNREKEKQIIGRAIRYQSHAALPEDQRNVLIQRYLATPKPQLLDRLLGRQVKGTDEYISDMALRKEQLNQQAMKLIADSQNLYEKNKAL